MQTFRINGLDYKAQNCIDDILIDPDLPKNFYNVRIDDRSPRHLEKWFGTAFIVSHDKGYKVFCLDGYGWDHPSDLGFFSSLQEAVYFASHDVF